MNQARKNIELYHSDIKLEVSKSLMSAVIAGCDDHVEHVAALTSNTFTGTDVLERMLGHHIYLDAIECSEDKVLIEEFKTESFKRDAQPNIMTANTYINTTDRKLDFIYLDYTKTWSSIQKDIIDLTERKVLRNNGVVALTVSTRCDTKLHKKWGMNDQVSQVLKDFNETKTENCIDMEMIELGYRKIYSKPYFNGGPMISLAYKKVYG